MKQKRWAVVEQLAPGTNLPMFHVWTEDLEEALIFNVSKETAEMVVMDHNRDLPKTANASTAAEPGAPEAKQK